MKEVWGVDGLDWGGVVGRVFAKVLGTGSEEDVVLLRSCSDDSNWEYAMTSLDACEMLLPDWESAPLT